MRKSFMCAVTLALLSAPAVASAQDTSETWLLMGSASGAAPLNDRHDNSYDAGVTGGIGLYRSILPQLQLGARVEGGALPVQDTDPDDSFDDNTLGLGALNAAARIRPLARRADPERGTGLYVEAAGGPGLLEDEVRPFLMPGAGYIFPIGDVGLGPTARYVHVFEPNDVGGPDNDLQMATVGIELVLLDERAPTYEPPLLEQPVPAPTERFEPAARVETTVVATEADTDGDGLRDSLDQCVTIAETVNGVDDHDGCPDSGELSMVGNKVVFDEKTFFEYDQAELRPEGKQKLDELVALYEENGRNWTRLRIQGHADARGPMPYNEDLGRQRALAVRDYLTEQGIPGEKIDVESYGETRPSAPSADTEREHQMNRRVEFVIER